MRGITPVVSIILLLIITVVIVGAASMFLSRAVSSAGSSAEQQAAAQSQQLASQFRIESVSGNKVYVRNMGTSGINRNSLAFYADGGSVAVSSGPDPLEKGSTGEYILQGFSWDSATVVKATGAGFGDSYVSDTPRSCKGILAAGRSNGNGVYIIQPAGASAFQVYCDMTMDGGGWMLVFICFPYGTGCYNNNQIGNSYPRPDNTDTTKFSDETIKILLNNGEKTARTQWWHTSKVYGTVWASGDLSDGDTQWNLFENPSQWSSSASSGGQRFKRKSGSAGAWTDWITSAGGGCSSAVGSWSNYFEQSCVQSWFAGCEGGPAINHDCGSPQDMADKLIVWVR